MTDRTLHTELQRLPHGSRNSGRQCARAPATAARRPAAVPVTIAACAAVKIWALVPLAVAGLVVVIATRRVRPALLLGEGGRRGRDPVPQAIASPALVTGAD